MDFTCGNQSHQRPGCLRGGGFTETLELRVLIAAQRFAPAAIGILDGLDPCDRPANVRQAHVFADRAQAAQHLPGSVNVIAAPAAKPRTIRALIALQESQRLLDALIFAGKPKMAQALQRARRDVAGAGINHRVMVGKRHLREQPFVIVLVKTGPATVPALHPEHPTDTATDGGRFLTVKISLDAVEGHQHHDGVVHVRVKFIIVFEEPPTDGLVRFGVAVAFGMFHTPITRPAHFLVQQPARGLLKGRVDSRQTGLVQGVDANRRVPHRRETRLEAQRIFFFDFELLHLADAGRNQKALVGVAESMQRHHVIGHGGENGAQPSRRPAMLDHPALCRAQCIATQRRERVMAVDEFEELINDQKEIVPGNCLRIPWEPDVRMFATALPELVNVPFHGQRLDRFLRADNRQRHKHRP